MLKQSRRKLARSAFAGLLTLTLLNPLNLAASTVEDLTSTVVFLRSVPTPGAEGGTGFLVALDDDHLYLATAEHVARAMTRTATITLRASGDRPLTFPLLRCVGQSKVIRWTKHQEADVAVLRLIPDGDLRVNLEKHFFPASTLLTERKAPDRDAPLTVLGFPLGLGVEREFSPISRDTKAASGLLTLPRFDTQIPATFFVMQDPSIGGYSGAPVIDTGGPRRAGQGLVLSAPTIVVGLVHGTLPDQTGGKLGVVTPSVFAVQTMQDDAAGRGETFTTADRPFVLQPRYVEAPAAEGSH